MPSESEALAMGKHHSPEFLKIVNDAKSRVRELNVPDVRRMLDAGEEFLLIDVREESEFAVGRLPGAQHIGKGVIERDIEVKVTQKDTYLVLYCGGGFRSVLAADNLQKMGYTNVWSMDGGYRGWKDAGHEVER
jgi:rhodanese-related sulfurtransferase